VCSRKACGAILAAALAVGCARKPPEPKVQRLAILPIENLTADELLGRVARLAAAAIQAQTTGLTDTYSYASGSAAESELGRPTRCLAGYLTKSGDRLKITLQLRDASSQKTLQVIEEVAGEKETTLALVDRLAKRVHPQARRFGTGNEEAARHYGQALESVDSGEIVRLLRRAVELDGSFGEARHLLVQSLAHTGDRAGALQAALEALGNEKLDRLSRARIAALRTALNGSVAERVEATKQLAELLPADAEVSAQLATYYMSRREYKQARGNFRNALEADPGWADVWNQTGYVEARWGDFDAAIEALKQYAVTAPGSANPQDSLGEVYFMAGRFAESEQAFLDSYQKQPGFLGAVTMRKAAEARRMRGDKSGADELFRKYTDAAASHPLLEVQKAQWEYSSGERARAKKRLEELAERAGIAPDLAAVALTQRSVWLLSEGDRAKARAMAEAALKRAVSPGVKRIVEIASFVAGAETSASEWSLRAERELPGPIRNLALAYALLLNHHFREAALQAKQIYEATDPNREDHIRELLALAYAGSGQWDEAAPLLRHFPIPQSADEPTFDCLVFPRGLELRARLAERAGDKQRASELMTLHRALSAKK